LPDLDGTRRTPEEIAVRITNQLLDLQGIGVDSCDMRRLRGSGATPHRARNKRIKRLAPPAGAVQRFPVFENFQPIWSRRFRTRDLLPRAARMPLPQLAVNFTRHHPPEPSRVLPPSH